MSQSDDDIFIDDDLRTVTVVDRVGPGGDIHLQSGAVIPGTLYWDHKPHTVRPKFTLRAPAAKHFFRYGSPAWLHDATGAFTCRLGIESGDPDLISEIGPDFQNCDPIDVDQAAVEGWDKSNVDPAKASKRTLKRLAPPTMAELRAREEG